MAVRTYIPIITLFFLIFKKINKFIYLFFMVTLGLQCCVQAFSSCGEQGLLFIVVHRLLIAVASLVVQQRLQACRIQ